MTLLIALLLLIALFSGLAYGLAGADAPWRKS